MQKYKLILGEIPKDFSPQKHIPIDVFCFFHREDTFPLWQDYSFVPDYFEDKNKRKEAGFLTSSFVLNYIHKTYAQINKEQGLSYGYSFWKILTYPWLLLITQNLYNKQRRLHDIIKIYKDYDIEVDLIKDNIDWKIADTIHIHELLKNSQLFSHWLYSRILENILPKNWKVNYLDVSGKIEKPKTHKPELKVKSFKNNLINTVANKLYRCYDVYGFKIWHQILFHFLLKLKRPINNTKIVDDFVKANIHWDFDYKKLVNKLIPQTILDTKNNAKAINRKFKNGKLNIYSSRLYFEDTGAKIQAALAIEYGEQIIAVQHGGHPYGSGLIHDYGTEVEFKSDFFISWGWQLPNITSIIGLPSPLLSKYKDKHQEKDSTVLLVGTAFYPTSKYFDSIPRPQQYINYIKNKKVFIRNLINNEKNYQFQYRPYLKSIFSDQRFIIDEFPNLRIFEGDLHSKLMEIKLLVLDHPGTTLNLALAANVPTICFWDSKSFLFNDEANQYLERFKQNGLFFETPVEAVKFIKELDGNVKEWWNSETIQKLRQEWVETYALSIKNWIWIWLKELWKLK